MIQRPTKPENWLYEDRGENDRYFTKIVALADGAHEWPECTDEAKEQWEEEHKPEPAAPEQEPEQEGDE